MLESERRPPTIVDVARHAGVSKSAVSRALLNQPEVSQRTRQAVMASATELGYIVNAMARGLAASRTHRVGLLIRDSANPIYGAMHTALQRRADEVDMSIVAMTVVSPDVTHKEQRALADLISLRVDGLIICSGTLPSAAIVPFLGQRPVVAVGRPETHPLINAISYDEVDCGQQLADHLADLGHRQVAVLLVPKKASISQHVRGTAAIRRLRRRGVTATVLPAPDGWNLSECLDAVQADEGITALMCPHDGILIRCLDLLAGRGLTVPDQLSVTGCDGIGAFASAYLGLTTFSLPVEATARLGIDLMQRLTQHPGAPVCHERVKGTLVRGRTTAAPATR